MKKVLLIGANSLVGSSIQKICKSHHQIQLYNFGKGDNLSEIECTEFDLAIFLAQSPDYKLSYVSNNLLQVNNSLLRDVLEWARGKVKNFVNFSSGSVYENTKDGRYTTNSDLAWNSKNPYVISKLMGEMIFRSFEDEFDSSINVRPFFIYGKGQKPGFLISRIISQLKNNNKVELNSGKGLIFNPIPAMDCAKIFMNPLINNSGYDHWPENINLSGDDIISLGDMVSYVIKTKSLDLTLLGTNAQEPNYFLNTSVELKLGTERSDWKKVAEDIYDAI